MKINNFQGELTDNSAKKEPLMLSLPEINDVNAPGNWPRALVLSLRCTYRKLGAGPNECSNR